MCNGLAQKDITDELRVDRSIVTKIEQEKKVESIYIKKILELLNRKNQFNHT